MRNCRGGGVALVGSCPSEEMSLWRIVRWELFVGELSSGELSRYDKNYKERSSVK